MFICDISVFNRYGKNKLDELLKPHDVDWQELVAILVIDEVPGINQINLNPFLQTDKGNVSKIIQILEEKGLMIRRADSKDRRSKVCFLTEQGKQMVPSLNKLLVEWERLAFKSIDENELETFRKVSRLISQNFMPEWNREGE